MLSRTTFNVPLFPRVLTFEIIRVCPSYATARFCINLLHLLISILWTFYLFSLFLAEFIFSDEVEEVKPCALASGGFLFQIMLKAPLQIPVRLVLVYSDVDSDREMEFTSPVAYFNSTTINHVASEDRVPFDKFRVRIALMYKRSMGPFLQQDNHYSE